jgi:hypothetical protein
VVVRTSKPGDKKERRRSVNLKRKGMGHVGSAIMQPKALTKLSKELRRQLTNVEATNPSPSNVTCSNFLYFVSH